MAKQEERRHTLQDDIEREAAQRWGELTDGEVAIEARLVDLHQCELTLEAGWIAATERAERQLPTFARASQNVVTMTALLDMLPRNVINSWDDLREIFTGNF
jgi:hypothetical protein